MREERPVASLPASTPLTVYELSAGESWSGRLNVVAILAEEDSEIQINRSRLYPMKSDEALTITGITITEVYVKKGQIKLIGTYVTPVALPRMITQRSVTIYGVESAVKTALEEYIRYIEGSPVDYATTDTMSDVVSIDARQFNEVTIMIKNTGGTNSADIAVYTLANTNGTIEYEEYSATLAPGDVAKIQLSGRYAKIIVRAKSTTAGASTTIRVEWIGGR